jgi:hypothetical protein
MLPVLSHRRRLSIAAVFTLIAATVASNVPPAMAQVLVDTQEARRFPRPHIWPVPLPTPRPAPPPSRYRI